MGCNVDKIALDLSQRLISDGERYVVARRAKECPVKTTVKIVNGHAITVRGGDDRTRKAD